MNAKHRTRVLIHAIAGGYGGAERTVECLIPYLAANFELAFYVENGLHIAKLEELSQSHNLEIIRDPGGRSIFSLLRSIVRTVVLCRRKNFDAVVTNTNKSALVMAVSRLFLTARLGMVVFIRDFQWSYARLIFRLLGERPVFAAPSEAISEHWPKHYGTPKSSDAIGPQQLSILPSAFKPKRGRIEILPDCFEAAASESDVVQKDKWLLVLGTVNRWKGIDVAIDALSKLGKGFENVGLRIVGREGDPGLVQELSCLAEQRGIGSRVLFIPHLENVDPVIASSLCVVSASVPWNGGPETFGRTVIEGWAWKRPVIASNCGGPLHLIEDGKDGLLFTAGDAEALATAIRTIVADPELAKSMGECGFRKYSRSYTSSAVAKSFEGLVTLSIGKVRDKKMPTCDF